MRSTVAKKRAARGDEDYDYLFGSFFQLPGFRSMDKANLNRRVGPIRESLFPLAVLEIHYRGEHSLTQLQGSPRVLRKGTLRMAPGLDGRDTSTRQPNTTLLVEDPTWRDWI